MTLTVLHDAVVPTSCGRVTSTPIAPLPVRPRRIVNAQHAGRVLAIAHRNRAVLPRWGLGSPVRCRRPEPGTYAGTTSWTSRQHYLDVIVPAAVRAYPDVLQTHRVSPDTFLRWAQVKSLYAQEARSGRQVIVRPDTLAGLLQCCERTVQRCNAAARSIGLELVITPGRMLTETETYEARRKGSPQRGLSTVTAFVVPQPLRSLVDHVTPTRGRSLSTFVREPTTFKQRYARPTSAPLRSAQHQRRVGPSWHLAAALTDHVIFLKRCPPGRIAGQLSRFTRCPHPWTAMQLTRAMDAVNVRLGYTAPTRATAAAWGLLAWYLGQIDEVADAPGFRAAIARI